jgi:hypothetical protein
MMRRSILLAVVGSLLVGGLVGARSWASPGGRLSLIADKPADKPKEKDEPAEPKLRDCTEAERKAVMTAIENQLKAFRADDYKAAEKYQHSSLKENFANTDEFRAMMRRGYPQVANYKSVSFGEAHCDEKAEQVQIRVSITGKDGVVVKLLYVMFKEDGLYKVVSVFGGGATKSEPRDVA